MARRHKKNEVPLKRVPHSTVIAKSGQRSSQSIHFMQSSGRAATHLPPSITRHSLGQNATQISQPLHHVVFTVMTAGFFEADCSPAICNLSGTGYHLANQ
mgnify:FL=1